MVHYIPSILAWLKIKMLAGEALFAASFAPVPASCLVKTMLPYPRRGVFPVLLACYLGIWAGGLAAADVDEIVRRATAGLASDWAADPTYSSVERDETQNGKEVTSKTFQVLMIDGSDYHLPLAENDQPLPPDRQKAELAKLRSEVQRRQSESQADRQARIDEWKKRRDEDGELLLDFSSALTFQFLREETKDGHTAYVLAGTPKKGLKPTTRSGKVLAGIKGTAWVEKDQMHPMRVECLVVTPVPVFGPLAHVLPGTRIEIEMTPVSESTWLIDEVSMQLKVSKLGLFKSAQMTRSTYKQYRPNSEVLEELLSGEGSK
jgi:hypothetical protein